MKDDEKPPALELLRSPDAEQLLAYLAKNGEQKAYETLKRYFPDSPHLERITGLAREAYSSAIRSDCER
jgi:hypothetical protein